jgi:F-type H+-transporting ATPase subunit b
VEAQNSAPTEASSSADEATASAPAHPEAESHGPEVEEHVSASQESQVLAFQMDLAVYSVIVFVLLLLVLGKFAWKPLVKALDDRERYHEETLRQAEHARAESERLLAEHRGLMTQANDQVRALIEQARKDAETTAESIVKKAHDEAENNRQRAERDIAHARDQALVEIWSKTADLAVSVAGKVLSRELGPDEQRRMVDVAMNELPQAPSANGQGVGS